MMPMAMRVTSCVADASATQATSTLAAAGTTVIINILKASAMMSVTRPTTTCAMSTGPGRTLDGTPLRCLPRLPTPPTVNGMALVRSTLTQPTQEEEEEEGGARRRKAMKGTRERRWPRKEIKVGRVIRVPTPGGLEGLREEGL